MAITGLLVQTLMDEVQEVETRLAAQPGATTYGVHQDQYVVAVLEAPHRDLEDRLRELEEMEGVLKIYTTYLNLEDEMPSLAGEGAC